MLHGTKCEICFDHNICISQDFALALFSLPVSHLGNGKGKGKKSSKEEEKGEDVGLEKGEHEEGEEKENKKQKIEKNGMISDSDEED